MFKFSRNSKWLIKQKVFFRSYFLAISSSESLSGLILLSAAVLGIFVANSVLGSNYQLFWSPSFAVFTGIGFQITPIALVNDGLMTFFFFLIGLEIRKEMYDGILSTTRQALLPFFAACGGVILPALIYLHINKNFATEYGWAIPTATDIAFAVGVLALLGKKVPRNLRVVLLALAIIDDVIAFIILALYYSSTLHFWGMVLIFLGLAFFLLTLLVKLTKIWVYFVIASLVWVGFYKTGIHPSLSGVLLGLMTPIVPINVEQARGKKLCRFLFLFDRFRCKKKIFSSHLPFSQIPKKIKNNRTSSPLTYLQNKITPWVTYGILPLFAFSNSGFPIKNINFTEKGNLWVFLGIFLGLFIGKPLGIFIATKLSVGLKICKLPQEVRWIHIGVMGCLAGIGFTMSLFTATIAFMGTNQLVISKIAILVGSVFSAAVGLLVGCICFKFVCK